MTGPDAPRPGSVVEPTDDASARALAVLDAALLNPAACVDRAREEVDATAGTDSLAEVLARRAAAITLRDGSDVQAAVSHARRARDLAAGLHDHLRSEAECTLALCLLSVGDGTGAVEAADRAIDLAGTHDVLRARALVQRALIRHRLADDGWQTEYDAAMPVLRDRADRYWEALARLNRGTEIVYLGRYADARADLQRAITLMTGRDGDQIVGFARHNLGFAAARSGDLPTALAAFEESERTLRALGVDTSPAVPDRAEALLAAGMVDEAATLLTRALPSLRDGAPALWPEVALLLARALRAADRTDDAVAHALDAAEAFRVQARPGWELLARTTHALAALPAGAIAPADALTVADRARAAGWVEAAVEVRATVTGLLAATAPDRAGDVLAVIDGDDTSLGLATRLAVAEARIALARATADPAALLQHAETAMADLDEHRALLGASELRANVSRHAERVLSQAALAAVELGDLDQALAWVDRVRSQALDHPPVVPPDDAELADALGRLRVVADAITRGRAGGEDVTALETERSELEQRVRDRTRTARGHGITDVETGTRAPGTIEVAWLNLDDHLVALVADDSGTRRLELEADTEAIGAELDALGFAMQRVGRSRAPGRRRDLAARSLEHSLAALDAALVAPLGLPDDGAVVLSPTSVLFDVPWSGLPSLLDRAVAIAPSLRLARRPARQDVGGGTLLVEGPRLDHARAELDALTDVVADPRVVLGQDATVAAARDVLPQARIAHLACHGVFRADNPQFSSLELADGPMFVYDLEALPRVPPLIVLSACQTGRSAVHAGDELLGVTASLLAMGARHVVAALADVPDDLSAVLMVAFHEAVATGASPAAALTRARDVLLADHDEPAARLTAAAFACVGAP